MNEKGLNSATREQSVNAVGKKEHQMGKSIPESRKGQTIGEET